VELIESAYLSDFTKKTLTQFGWQDGQPIPHTLGELLVQIKDRLPTASARSDVLIAIEDMQPDDIAQVKNVLAAAINVEANNAAAQQLEAQTANMSPSVREVYQKFLQETPQIVDDRANVTAPATVAPEPTAAATPEAAPDAPIDPTIEGAADAGLGGPEPVLPFCPRCGWDMKQKFDVEIAENDKEDFIAVLLGGARFRRDYEIAGGKMIVTFRSMLADENFLVQRQLLLDQAAGDILSESEWFVRFAEYRMACSLERIIDSRGKPVLMHPELADVVFTPPADKQNETALVTMRATLNKTALAHEVTRRIVQAQLRRFQRLVEALEAVALEPSFWTGIE